MQEIAEIIFKYGGTVVLAVLFVYYVFYPFT